MYFETSIVKSQAGVDVSFNGYKLPGTMETLESINNISNDTNNVKRYIEIIKTSLKPRTAYHSLNRIPALRDIHNS